MKDVTINHRRTNSCYIYTEKYVLYTCMGENITCCRKYKQIEEHLGDFTVRIPDKVPSVYSFSPFISFIGMLYSRIFNSI